MVVTTDINLLPRFELMALLFSARLGYRVDEAAGGHIVIVPNLLMGDRGVDVDFRFDEYDEYVDGSPYGAELLLVLERAQSIPSEWNPLDYQKPVS